MICFVFAMDKEATFLLDSYPHKQQQIGFAKYYECEGPHGKFAVLVSGIGKVFAGSALSALLALKKDEIDGVINLGVGGSLNGEKAGLFSCLIGSAYLQHDLDTSPIGDPIGMVSGIDVIRFPGHEKLMEAVAKACAENGIGCENGTICSGDQFIAQEKQKEEILAKFEDAISIDMESAAFAQVAYVYAVPYVAARFISDVNAPEEYHKNLPVCAQKLAIVAKWLIDHIA